MYIEEHLLSNYMDMK